MPLQKPYRGEDAATQPSARRRAPVVVATVVVILLAAIAIPFSVLDGGSQGRRAGCVQVTAASSTGGASFTTCGRSAVELCRAQATGAGEYASAVRAACRRAGVH